MIIDQPVTSEDTESMAFCEVDVCKIFFGYIFFIFAIICVHFTCFYLMFDFFFLSGFTLVTP